MNVSMVALKSPRDRARAQYAPCVLPATHGWKSSESAILRQEVTVSIAPEVLELLACPKCHGGLRGTLGSADSADPKGFVCEACKLFFALDDGLPNMLLDEARAWPLCDASASA